MDTIISPSVLDQSDDVVVVASDGIESSTLGNQRQGQSADINQPVFSAVAPKSGGQPLKQTAPNIMDWSISAKRCSPSGHIHTDV